MWPPLSQGARGAGQRLATDSRLAALNRVMSRVEAAARGLARLATIAAVAGGTAGLVLWWSTVGHGIGRHGHSAAVAVVVLGLCLVPAGWLLNVRMAMLALLGLPATVSGVVARRGARLVGGRWIAPGPERPSERGHGPERPSERGHGPERGPGTAPPIVEVRTGRLASVRTIRGAVRDYGDVTGSWARLGQLLTPTFWVLTGLAFLAVPILMAVAAVAGLLALVT